MAFGSGVIRGMGITLRHLVDSYVIGFKDQPAAAGDLVAPTAVRAGMPVHTGGMQTVQYPEEKLPVPERFRYLPFLLYEDDAGSERAAFDGIRCTACGICAKVCPPQCIWIVQGKGEDGKPRPVATEFYIDASICMSCGFCAEYCPFDAIKMDHDYELSSYERHESWVYDLQELLHPVAYHAAIHPTDWQRELEEQRAKDEAKRRKAEAKAKKAAEAAGDAEDPEAAKQRKLAARQKMLDARKAREAAKAAEAGEDGSGDQGEA
jgi:NADH-quinone oxidoreductase subunit I